MTVVHEPGGKYQSYIKDGDFSAEILGDWINLPGPARTIDFFAKWTGASEPVGTISIEATDVTNANSSDDIVTPVGTIDVKQKAVVRVATAAALPANTASGTGVGKTLTMDSAAVLTVDGKATVLDDLILVQNEAAAADNGKYKVTTEGTGGVAAILTRAVDFDQDAEVIFGAAMTVTEGTANAGKSFRVSTPDPIIVDTTAIVFEEGIGNGEISIAVIKRSFYRAKYTRTSGGAVDSLQMSARVGQ